MIGTPRGSRSVFGESLPHGMSWGIHVKVAAVHQAAFLVQRLIQPDAASGLLHPAGPMHLRKQRGFVVVAA